MKQRITKNQASLEQGPAAVGEALKISMDIQFFEIQFFEIQFHGKPWQAWKKPWNTMKQT